MGRKFNKGRIASRLMLAPDMMLTIHSGTSPELLKMFADSAGKFQEEERKKKESKHGKKEI